MAGRKHYCPPGKIFFAGIGGHLEAGESLTDCAIREAKEEIDALVELRSAAKSYYLTGRSIWEVDLDEDTKPLAIYEMIHPAGTPREGQIYYLVIYDAVLEEFPKNLQAEEVSGLVSLTSNQLVASLNQQITLGQLQEGGGRLVMGGEQLDETAILFPIGTAKALAQLLSHLPGFYSSPDN
ncbi:MAG: NUDIX domain-containing protein [Halanaerobium sp.]|nr:NUDIX domain-containing protein [Halanaerobium sp.]